MGTQGNAPFDTAIGCCVIAWSDRGVTGVRLPAEEPPRAHAQRQRLVHDAVPPAATRRAIVAIGALLSGERVDLRWIELDYDGVAPFERVVYEAAREIGPGDTVTYGELAARIGDRAAARAVGRALARNPFAIVVPCHRVLAAGGRIGGFSAPGGPVTKARLLAIEGAGVATAPLFA